MKDILNQNDLNSKFIQIDPNLSKKPKKEKIIRNNSKLNITLETNSEAHNQSQTHSRSKSPNTRDLSYKQKIIAPQWISHSIIGKLIENLNNVYIKNKIPSFHKDYFNENIYTL